MDPMVAPNDDSLSVNALEKSSHERRHTLWLIIFGFICGVIAMNFRQRPAFDDTFITFRYVQNLVAGEGLCWNVGGAPTEGFSNLLFVLVLAPLSLLFSDLLLVSQVLSCISVVVSAVAISRLVREVMLTLQHDGQAGIAYLAGIVWLLNPVAWVNALSGLETSFYVMVVLCGLWSFLRAHRTKSTFAGTFIWFFCAALTRPEGALVGVTCATFLLLDSRARAGIYFLLAFVGYTCFRYFYFGSLLPNPAFIKVVDLPRTATTFFRGTHEVADFIRRLAPLAPGFIWFAWNARKHPPLKVVLLWLLLTMLFWLFPEHQMGYYDRFLLPLEAVLLAIAVAASQTLEWRKPTRVAFFSFVMLWNVFFAWRREMFGSFGPLVASYREIGQLLGSIKSSDGVYLASADAGILPYYSKMRHLDLVGLNSNKIARSGSVANARQILIREKPDLVLIPSYKSPRGDSCWYIPETGHGYAAQLQARFPEDPAFASYRRLVTFRYPLYKLTAFVNQESARYLELKQFFEARLAENNKLLEPPIRCFD